MYIFTFRIYYTLDPVRSHILEQRKLRTARKENTELEGEFELCGRGRRREDEIMLLDDS